MELPTDILLSKIVPKHLYLDKKSKESSTNIIKGKYKLAGNQILDQYFFNILTRKALACKTHFTICIERKDWENRVSKSYPSSENSYCDITKYELISKIDLIRKIKDKNNGFPFIAKLCEQKCRELENLKSGIGKCPYISSATKDIINRGIAPAIDHILSKLGLD